MSELHQLTDDIDIDELISHLTAFSIAEREAMGVMGRIIMLTDRNKSYETNYIHDKLVQNILEKLPVDHAFFNSSKRFNSSPKNPLGWKYTYLGCGNHLFMKDWLDAAFYKVAHKSETNPHLYRTWLEIANRLVECKRIAGGNPYLI